jgi:mRNA interferase MazF
LIINQGDIFWLKLRTPNGSEPGFRRPYVVVQNDVFNASRINTAVVCAVTSNFKWAKAPGNVTLNKGEANLSKKSVVNISQVVTVDRSYLEDKIGSLSSERIKEVIEGMKLLIDSLPDPRSKNCFKT